MTDHVHIYDRPPVPAAKEDGDYRPNCACGRRQPAQGVTGDSPEGQRVAAEPYGAEGSDPEAVHVRIAW